MIESIKDLKFYIKEDAKKSMRKSTRSSFLGDEIWKFQKNLRWYEFFKNTNHKFLMTFPRIRHHYMSIRLGIEINPNNFEHGLWIGHRGGIVVNPNARVGCNCTILQNTTIGNNSKNNRAPRIGNDCFIGAGAIILGDIVCGNNIKFGAGSVTVKSYPDNSVLIGVPSKNIGAKKEMGSGIER